MGTGTGQVGTRRHHDPRIDALIRWSLGVIFMLAVSLVTWFISDVRANQTTLATRLRVLETENAVLRERAEDNRESIRAQWRVIQDLNQKLGFPPAKK